MLSTDKSYVVVVDNIPITITHKRVRNINLRIGPRGDARMSVPMYMSKSRATEEARSHASWFRTHVARVTARRREGPVLWETGESLCVWGKERRLSVACTHGVPSCQLDEELLVIRVPEGTTPEGRGKFVERWLREQMRERLNELVPLCEERVGAHATSITLRRMKSRWGSCTSSTGRIRLNVALAERAPKCLEMVLIHELCHLLVANHGPRFRALMDLHCPDWRVWQRMLNEHPPRV